MTTVKVPKPPAELGKSGRELWQDVQTSYELERHETALLIEMCRTADALDGLAAIVADEGAMITDHLGNPKVHPAAVEARQMRIAFARLSAALRLPAGDEDDQQGARRPQRRVGFRGPYGIRRTA